MKLKFVAQFLVFCSMILLGVLIHEVLSLSRGSKAGVIASQEPPDQRRLPCTQMGCSDGLLLKLEGSVPSTFVVEVIENGQTRVATKCSGYGLEGSDVWCLGNYVHLVNYMPEEVEVRVTWKGGGVTERFKPSYSTSYPNGPECGPACEHASISIDLSSWKLGKKGSNR